MASSWMLRPVTVVGTDFSEELSASIIRVTRIGELVTASVVPSLPILVTLIMEALSSSETSVLTRATRLNIPDDAILRGCFCFVQLGSQVHVIRATSARSDTPCGACRRAAMPVSCGREMDLINGKSRGPEASAAWSLRLWHYLPATRGKKHLLLSNLAHGARSHVSR
jgi:hypothetical protein